MLTKDELASIKGRFAEGAVEGVAFGMAIAQAGLAPALAAEGAALRKAWAELLDRATRHLDGEDGYDASGEDWAEHVASVAKAALSSPSPAVARVEAAVAFCDRIRASSTLGNIFAAIGLRDEWTTVVIAYEAADSAAKGESK